jgi:hypothetical protein
MFDLRARITLFALASCVAVMGCPSPKAPEGSGAARGACGKLEDKDCDRVKGMLSAMDSFSNVNQELILDARSTFVPGRGLEKTAGALWKPTTTECARPRNERETRVQDARIDPNAIDFSFIGVAIDEAIVSARAPISQVVTVGAEARVYNVRLLAVAFARDLDPQFFGPSDSVSYRESACSCDRATHFVGAVKYGGMLSYETTVKGVELNAGTVLDVVKAKIFAEDTDVRQVSVGGLTVKGLEEQLAGHGTKKPLEFTVKNPVPIAYAVYPVSDVCKFSMPVPEVAPSAIDFGLVPTDKRGSRFLHVTNRAPFDVVALAQGASYAVPALGSLDVPVEYRPQDGATACQHDTREETIVFSPRDEGTPVMPRQHSVRVELHARSGASSVTRTEKIDSGIARRPDYETTGRDVVCPPGYAVASCMAEHAECSDGKCGPGFVMDARPNGNGCHFGCRGPRAGVVFSEYCRMDGIMQCKLRCE